jgi:hypothetical protein
MAKIKRLRTYTQKGIYPHTKLVTWIQLRCVVCSRFLKTKQLKYCSICKPIKDKDRRKYYQDNKEKID